MSYFETNDTEFIESIVIDKLLDIFNLVNDSLKILKLLKIMNEMSEDNLHRDAHQHFKKYTNELYNNKNWSLFRKN